MNTLTQLIGPIIAIIVLARVGTFLSRRVGLASVTIQLLIGILLGPSLFNLLGTPMVLGIWGSPSPGPLYGVLKILAEIGLIQLMFLAGLEVDWHDLKKLFKSSLSVGVWGSVLTAASVAILTRVFVNRWSEALALSSVVSASNFGISIYCFSEMKVLGSRVASTVSGAAILSGLLAILLMIASKATNYAMAYGAFKMTIAVSWFLAKLIMFFAIAYFLTSQFLKLVAKTGFAKRPRQMLIGYLLLVASLYAWAALHFGSFAAVGVASLGGMLLGTPNLEVKKKITKGFESISTSIPVGILFMVMGMEVNFKEARTYFPFLAGVFIIVVGAKLVGSWIATPKEFESVNERLLIMIGFFPQGEMGMLIAAYLFSRGLLNPSSFNIAIIAVVVLTMVAPIASRIASTGFNVQTASSVVVDSKGSSIKRA